MSKIIVYCVLTTLVIRVMEWNKHTMGRRPKIKQMNKKTNSLKNYTQPDFTLEQLSLVFCSAFAAAASTAAAATID